ncbi:hypothetical protein [Lactobacillus delbrueckii]|uniref:hypothetical protein n=1 Tax=Lactobacillus delbrueckii TaxID=1584 RepID=UPI000731EB94|nr:hypothetical protein [Lactobacillus delbrueckii]ALT48121.1 hypothetical protein AT236_01764 [Lactobacillus delbrueckii subsp. bulgaricus]MCD5464249.1 hypothetical protein [Lactobacillus delbrueckii subsp. bulgaricus]MCD5474681.1 hypothetical protein [Lactobacillus delbrueckii subsp. bulgaricus]
MSAKKRLEFLLGVFSLFAAWQSDDLVSDGQGAEPVGDQDYGLAAPGFLEGFEDDAFV